MQPRVEENFSFTAHESVPYWSGTRISRFEFSLKLAPAHLRVKLKIGEIIIYIYI